MKKILFVLLAVLSLNVYAAQPKKAAPKPDYSQIRGVCYLGWRGNEATVRQQLGYGQRIGLNSTRIWLGGYERDPQGFINGLKNYVKIADSMGYTVMPILFNGNGLNPDIIKEENWPAQERYVRATVSALKDAKGLLCWDIMNEPTCNDYYRHAPSPEVAEERADEIFRFVRKVCLLVKEIAPDNDICVGVTYPKFIERASPDLCDMTIVRPARSSPRITRSRKPRLRSGASR